MISHINTKRCPFVEVIINKMSIPTDINKCIGNGGAERVNG